MKFDRSILKFTKDGHIITPAMLVVDCSMRATAGKGATASLSSSAIEDTAGHAASGVQASSGTTAADDGSQGADPDPNIVSVVFRLISASMVSPGIWFAPGQLVDFSHADARALKEAAAIINATARPVPVMWNHTFDMQAKAGRLSMAFWEQSADIPPGVNASVVVNRLFDPKAAVGLELGELNAGSIGIDNVWSLSHPDMDIEEFVERQGEEVDGQLVRWLPEHTTEINHYALVPAGADPDAGPRRSSLSKHVIDLGFGRGERTEGGRDMKGFVALLQLVCARLGISVALTESGPLPEKLDERVTAELDGILSAAKKYNGLAADVEKLGPGLLKEGEVKLSAEQVLERLPAALAFVPQGKAYLEDVRTAVLKAFDTNHVKPDKQTMGEVELRERKRIEASMDLEYLKDQLALLEPKAAARFGPHFKVSENEDPAGGASATNVDKRIQAQLLKQRLGK